jgi:CBS domain-containing protein
MLIGRLVMLRRIADMVRSGEVYRLPPSATVVEAAREMKAKACGAVIVMKHGRLEGIFTERDLVNRVVARELDPAQTKLAEVMTRNPDSIRPDACTMDGLRMMEDGGYRHLPVIKGGQVVGVVSRRDFFGEEKAQLDHERTLWESVA